MKLVTAGVISGALLYIKDDFEAVKQSSFLQVQAITDRSLFHGGTLCALSVVLLEVIKRIETLLLQGPG